MGCSDEGGSRGTAPHINWSSLQGLRKSKWVLLRGDPKAGWGLFCWLKELLLSPSSIFIFNMTSVLHVHKWQSDWSGSSQRNFPASVLMLHQNKNWIKKSLKLLQKIINETNKVLIQVKRHPSSKKIHVRHVRSCFYVESEPIPDTQTFWFWVSGWKIFQNPQHCFAGKCNSPEGGSVCTCTLAYSHSSQSFKRLWSHHYHKNVWQFYNQH